jgi:Fe-S-cluster containining protein
MITDLVQIRRLGERSRGENERLRRTMKRHQASDRRLRRIAGQVEEQIDCTACANCCRVATARIIERDVEPLARHLGVPPARFVAEYTEESGDEGRILKRTPTGCIFLQENLCSVYEARPQSCRNFPHLVRGPGSLESRMWEMIDRACYCPIVFNTLEEFKRELGVR